MQETYSPTRNAVPAELQSPRAKLVYFYLNVADGATVEELQERLGMRKLTLYSVLKALCEREFVAREGDAYALA